MRQRRRRSLVVVPLAVALSVPLGLTPVAAADGKGGLGRPNLPSELVTKVKPFSGPATNKARQQVAKDQRENGLQVQRARAEQKQAVWPKAGAANLDLAVNKAQTAAPGGLPVSVGPSAGKEGLQAGTETAITVLDQAVAGKLGITGVVLTAGAESSGKARISVDYGAFASAIGGGWSGRLQLVQLPGCALTTPQKPACRTQTFLGSRNNIEKHTVSADVAVPNTDAGIATQLGTSTSGPTVLALTGSASGQSTKGTGDHSATPLAASSSWSAGGSSGSFTWSHGFTVPPAAAGPAPSLHLAYDSGSVDGRTATTNNQGTSVGEGFSLTESYIERAYGSCDDDGQTDVFDRCWKYDNARLVLNGKSSRLVKVSDATWRLENDDASKVTRSTGAENDDDNGEYWTVVTGDGTKHVFGLNKLDGATTQRTNSAWAVPVFGDDAGEPGYDKGSTFAERSALQAWRWNLDYVEDTRGNAATYWYAKESNYYKKNKAAKADAEYTRGGYLTEIQYGLRKDANGSLFTDSADAKVTFGYAERCTAADCTSLTKDTAENWPDVPFDAICAQDSTECLSQSPSFFSRKRLTGIDTLSWKTSTSTYDPVDSWKFGQEYLDGGDIGDTSDQVLTLTSITRTAKAGTTAIKMDPISFTYQMRPNRVDGTDDILPLTRPRISTITNETGAITTVTLSAQECVRSQVLTAPQDSNTRNCYPQYWNINGAKEASVDWFHKYRVLGVVTTDPAGQNDAVENEYVYSGAAWHHSDDPFTPKAERTWSEWRGYREVTVYKGSRNAPVRSKTVSLYMQGMDGDPNKDGTTKSVPVAPLAQPPIGLATVTDSDQYSGTLREQVTYDGATPISASANEPWSKETARQAGVPDSGDHVARFVRTKKTTSYTYLTAAQKWRSSNSETVSFDAEGRAVKVVDNGDLSKEGDETCTQTWYADNDDLGLTSLVSRVRTVASDCSFAEADLKLQNTDGTRGNVMSDKAMAYDNLAWSDTMKPTKGLATWTGRAETYGTPIKWQKIASTSYDALGRPTAVSDADGKSTTTTYTPTEAGPLTRRVATNAASHKVFNYLDPRRGLTVSTFDPNLKKTELAYDALGRLTDVWLPNRIRGSESPNTTFQYTLSNTKQSWVSTSTLKADGATYNTSYAIYDALLRPLQTQSPTPKGGRLLTDTRYDSRGLAYETHADIFDSGSTPNGAYMRVAYGAAPTQTQIVFDGAERQTSSTLLVGGVEKWTTTTTYTGDSTAITAVEGGTAGRTIVDARGRTLETREYAGTSPTDAQYGATLGTAYTSTKFEYTLDGKQTKITGPDGAVWSYTYDQYGRQKTATDPDKGTTWSEYDAMDRVTQSTTDGKTVLSAYDQLGRPTFTWAGSMSDQTLLTERTYDTPLKGQPATSTRYVGGKGQAGSKAYTKTVTSYDALSRPTTTELALPATEALYASVPNGKLAFTTSYRLDGTVGSTSEPALGGLPSEIVQYGYGSVGQLTSVKGLSGYLQYADYSALGQVQQMTLGLGGTGDRSVYVSNSYEPGTGRLTRSNVTDQTHPYMLQDLTYTFDQVGNVLSIADPATLGGTGKAETQCFTYDGHLRLTEAWTPASQKCSDARSASTLAGPAPYWTSYTYNQGGQRQLETQHAASGDTTTTYCYNPDKQPHALRYTTTRADVDCKAAADPAKDKVYDYDTAGNTTKRPGATGQQNLTWSHAGQLAALAEGTEVTDYVYDADGTLLIRGAKNGERILYVGATELHLPTGKAAWAQRTYTAGGAAIAVRTNQSGTAQVLYLAGDHHGTQSLAVTSDATQKITKRYMTPFGAERGGAIGTWPTDRGFLDKTADKITGLTHIGAREYDPSIGQFISVDPALVVDQHQSLNGYAYANNTPVTSSDSTGLWLDDGWGHAEPGGPLGGHESSTPGQPVGGTGPGGCYYNCPKKGNGGTSSTGDSGDTGTVTYDTSTSTPVDQVFYGLIRNAPDTASYFGWLADGDCWNGGAGAPGCDYAADYDQWMLEQGVDTNSDWYQVPGFVVALLGHGRAGAGPGAGGTRVKWMPKAGGQCFLAGTLVVLADGTSKKIEDIAIGDEVLATDPETGESGARPVTQLIRTEETKHLNTISIATPDGTETLTATAEHPFWSASQHSWVAAKNLKPGMTLLTDKGETVAVNGNVSFTKHVKTYNFTVDDLHTYYVLAGRTPVLVHNTCLDVPQVLSELAGKRETHGRIFDASGKEMHGEIQAGGSGPLVQATDAYLRNHGTPINPKTKYYPASQHVETQFAAVMRKTRTTSATVVINKKTGVCGGPFGCKGAVQQILPFGYTMTVWYPNAETPEVIKGRAVVG
ncbi:polymorphic toxin-type HINT domain-containing protein [Streptomyces sp. NPDC127114]|uniref:polymorphic toxin-type HINT domain-containing protein n=1 Tax=Streptomyces sp. NPDC127114 TaxID=3345366 RepID=UPI003626498D